jgi:hypothetical protein
VLNINHTLFYLIKIEREMSNFAGEFLYIYDDGKRRKLIPPLTNALHVWKKVRLVIFILFYVDIPA